MSTPMFEAWPQTVTHIHIPHHFLTIRFLVRFLVLLLVRWNSRHSKRMRVRVSPASSYEPHIDANGRQNLLVDDGSQQGRVYRKRYYYIKRMGRVFDSTAERYNFRTVASNIQECVLGTEHGYSTQDPASPQTLTEGLLQACLRRLDSSERLASNFEARRGRSTTLRRAHAARKIIIRKHKLSTHYPELGSPHACAAGMSKTIGLLGASNVISARRACSTVTSYNLVTGNVESLEEVWSAALYLVGQSGAGPA
ncbi:hypothetical protein JB92DRAFT_2827050 [Gautieria morchelliformis]|nr:hypothetical protein JB92DRAFT_2827050 [Gautieria morchelliformis]